jgi:membrane-bound ClpP family serine protease
MRTYQRTEVSDPAVASVEPAEVEVTESEFRFSPAQIVHAAIGVFLVVLGILAMVRGDLGDLTGSQFAVLGITHNAAIGLGEVIAGALLLLAAASPGGRFLGLVVGLAMIVFGAVLLGDEQTMRDVGTEDALAWLAIVLGAGAVVSGLIPARRTRRRRVDRSII